MTPFYYLLYRASTYCLFLTLFFKYNLFNVYRIVFCKLVSIDRFFSSKLFEKKLLRVYGFYEIPKLPFR
jgi:hypothetical protein